MSDVTKHERTERYVDYVLPNPTCIGEFLKAYSWAKQDADKADDAAVLTGYDDWLTVSADDEHITLTWQRQTHAPGSLEGSSTPNA